MSTDALGSSLIAAAGVGSTDFNVETMAVGLADAEVGVARIALTDKQEQDEAKLSAWGTLKSTLSGFQDYLSPLSLEESLLQRTVTSSDSSVVTASVSSSAAAGSYSIEVTQLAKAHSIYSKSFSSTADTVGTGSLSFSFGTVTLDGSGDPTAFVQNADKASQTVTIEDGSLEGIRDAVNDADFGVQASIVNDGSGYRLTFTSTETGAENAIQIAVDDDDSDDSDDLNLSQLSFNTTSSNLEQSTAGEDAQLKVNGLSVTSASNSVDDVVDGATLTLFSVDAGVPKTVTIAYDSESLKTAVTNFVGDYNAMKEVLDSHTSYDIETGESGEFQGDSMVRGIKSELRSLTSLPVDNLSGTYTSLTSIGVEFDSEGTLSIDEETLDSVLASDFSSISDLFIAQGKPSDSQVKFEALTEDTEPGVYSVDITQVASQASLAIGETVDTLVVDSTNDNLRVYMDGILSNSISLTQKTYASKDELAAEIQSKINGDSNLDEYQVTVSVSYNSVSNGFEITSDRYGTASRVRIFSVDDSSASIGLASSTDEVAGLDVAGTINGEAATGSGRYLTSSTGSSEGLEVYISGGSTGDRGTVTVSRGVADQLATVIDKYIETDGLIEGREETLNEKLDDYELQSEELDERYEELLARYRTQFSILNGLLGSMEQQREWMAATFEGMSG